MNLTNLVITIIIFSMGGLHLYIVRDIKGLTTTERVMGTILTMGTTFLNIAILASMLEMGTNSYSAQFHWVPFLFQFALIALTILIVNNGKGADQNFSATNTGLVVTVVVTILWSFVITTVIGMDSKTTVVETYKPGEFQVFDGYLVVDKKPVAGIVDYSEGGLSKDEVRDLETEINSNLVGVYVQVVEEHSPISRFFFGRDLRYIRYKLDK